MPVIKIQFVLTMICMLPMVTARGYEYDANDFAVEVVEYIEGEAPETDYIDGLPFNNPANALGRPTVDTTGDNWNVVWPFLPAPVVDVYPSFRSFELVTVGDGGRLIVRFNHPVRDDENNPYGVDFIVFGNAQQKSGTGLFWQNKNPTTFIVNSSEFIGADEAIVSVSQDGINWYSFSSGPYADSFAPTFGRVYDGNNPDQSIGSWNLWWGYPTDPTLPLDTALTPQNFVGKSVAEISQMYGESAGGTGFDLSESGMEWIEYVKSEGRNGSTPEVDAVADVSACGDWKHPYPGGDITHDCQVDYEDFALLSDFWLEVVTGPEEPAAAADIYGDNMINFKDWAIMADAWLQCSWQCE